MKERSCKIMIKKEFPILEFDESKEPFIKPSNVIKPIQISERCVLCFFGDAIDIMLSKYKHRVVARFKAEHCDIPIYEVDYKGQKVCLAQAAVGAPVAGAMMDELTAYGCKKFIACGSCGVLQKEIAVGHLIIVKSAVRDEGTSYHYVAPSREITANGHVVKCIEKTVKQFKIDYIKAKTWTTDAYYRETPLKIEQRKKEGCVTVEMEASAFIAVAQYNDVIFGQILYAGDCLGGEAWDDRKNVTRSDIRELVLEISIEACLEL